MGGYNPAKGAPREASGPFGAGQGVLRRAAWNMIAALCYADRQEYGIHFRG